MRQPARPPQHIHPGSDDLHEIDRGVALGVLLVLGLCGAILGALLLIPGGGQ